MRRWLLPGNPSSVHAEGRAARRVIENAREEVAALVGARPGDVFFTSSGTEANMLALTPAIETAGEKRPRDAAAYVGDRACLGARRRPVSAARRSRRSRSTATGLIDLAALAAAVGQIAAAAGLADARQ